MTVLEVVLTVVLSVTMTMVVIRVMPLKRSDAPDYSSLLLEVDRLRKELLEAYRRIDQLEKKEANLQEIIATLQKQQAGSTENKKITVLGIWSGDNLNTVGERDAIYDSGIEYRALFGPAATKANIIHELRQGNITIIEIGAHGDAQKIFIDEEGLSAGWWQRVLSSEGVRVAIILACFSDMSIADAMRRAGVQSVVAVQGEIDDKAAVEFAQQFYQLYAAGMSVAQAFEEAKLAIDYRQAERLVLRSK